MHIFIERKWHMDIPQLGFLKGDDVSSKLVEYIP